MAPPAGGAWRGSATVATSAGDATVLLAGSGTGGGPPPSAPTARSRRWSRTACSTPATPSLSPWRAAGAAARRPGARRRPVEPARRATPSDGGHAQRHRHRSRRRRLRAGLPVRLDAGQLHRQLRAGPDGGQPRHRAGAAPTAGCASGRWWTPTSSSTWPAGTRRPRRRRAPSRRRLPDGRAGAGPRHPPGRPGAGRRRRASWPPARRSRSRWPGTSGFPADARAALLNLTVTEPDGRRLPAGVPVRRGAGRLQRELRGRPDGGQPGRREGGGGRAGLLPGVGRRPRRGRPGRVVRPGAGRDPGRPRSRAGARHPLDPAWRPAASPSRCRRGASWPSRSPATTGSLPGPRRWC